MRGGVLEYAAQATSQIDAEIGKKDHFRMETSLDLDPVSEGPDGAETLQKRIRRC